jgi:hypothetical protein
MSRILLASLFLAATAPFAACLDQGHAVTYVNETDQTVIIYYGDDLDDREWVIGPGEVDEVGTLKHVWTDVLVFRDEDGNVLERRELTWGELKAQDYRVVIRAEDLGIAASDPTFEEIVEHCKTIEATASVTQRRTATPGVPAINTPQAQGTLESVRSCAFTR